jgi:ABC-type nitrate/sulfonate/bicarbonate transport system permease component
MQNAPEPLWEIIAGYVLAIVIGVALALVLFYGLSS